MKKLAILLVLLFLQTMTGCRSTKIEKVYVLPPKPQRKEIQAPQDLQDYAQIINYYEHLVEEWEVWGELVEEMVK